MADVHDMNPTDAAWRAVSAAFGSLGRVFICLDPDFRIIHASEVLDEFLGDGAADAVAGRPVESVVGDDLLGENGSMRHALLAGERREGWRAHVSVDGEKRRLVSMTAAPFRRPTRGGCDPRVAYVLVLRPAEDEPLVGGEGPMAFEGLVARSPAMVKIFHLVESLRSSEATVLLTGESGTGKEVVARALHTRSPRAVGSFVAVNCGALPPELLESELFGHVKGAFTGAVRDREGRFSAANGGTLLLDEIGDCPLPLQVKLLRVLQDGSYQRVGDNHTHTSGARVIAATNQDLPPMIREGRFREDLYYRLRVVPIEIPPLRHRREDIEPLARVLLARVAARQGRSLRFSANAVRQLLQYSWPGNVRELENAIEYAVAVCQRQTILPEDLPAEVRGSGVPSPAASVPPAAFPAAFPAEFPEEPSGDPPTESAGEGSEREHLRRVLEAHQWRRAEAARALGVSRTTLWRRMRECGLA